MKLKLITLSALCLIASLSWAQTLLYNDGATIKIQAGATLYVEGGVHSTATATVDNDGTFEIKGDFTNLGTWEPSQNNTLKFSGNTVSNVNSAPTVVYQDVAVSKSGANVVLTSHMTVSDSLIFGNAGVSILETGNFDLILGNTAKAGGYDTDAYVATTGTGMMQKGVTADGSFEFPVGDIANYSPLTSAYTGTAYSSATIRVKANDLTHPNKPSSATEYISRYWDVDAAGITTYSNILTGTYVPADLTLGTGGTAAQVKGAVYDGTNWSYVNASTSGNTVTGTTDDLLADFTGTNFFGSANIKVFLAGALPGTGVPPMTTTLNNSPSLIPLNSPYSVAPWNAPMETAVSIPPSTTDWILVETRDLSNVIISQTSAFLKNDGTIMNMDGTTPLRLKNALPNAYVSIRHRNHLAVRTANTLDLALSTPITHDFSTGTSQAWTNVALANANMRLMGSTYALWGGNANISNSIALSRISYIGAANDPQAVLAAMSGNSGVGVLGVYSNADVNLNRNITYIGAANDPQTILLNMSGNSGVATIQHLP